MILSFVFAKSCVSDFVKGGDKEKIEQYKQMISDNSFVVADLSNEYTQTKVARVIYLYTFDYSFELNGNFYSGKIVLNQLPNSRKLKLFYLVDNPNIVSDDPGEDLKTEKGKGQIKDLIFGIIWGIAGLIFLISFVLNLGDLKLNKITISNSNLPKPKKEVKVKAEKLESPQAELSEEEKLKIEQERERRRKEKEDPSRFMPK
jgi:hypothetical protein